MFIFINFKYIYILRSYKICMFCNSVQRTWWHVSDLHYYCIIKIDLSEHSTMTKLLIPFFGDGMEKHFSSPALWGHKSQEYVIYLLETTPTASLTIIWGRLGVCDLRFSPNHGLSRRTLQISSPISPITVLPSIQILCPGTCYKESMLY